MFACVYLLDRKRPLSYYQYNARDAKNSKLIGHRVTTVQGNLQ